jgi:hypothetical protein
LEITGVHDPLSVVTTRDQRRQTTDDRTNSTTIEMHQITVTAA